MNHSKKNLGQNVIKKSQRGGEKENSCYATKKTEPSLISCMNATTAGDFYRSEHSSNYIWHNTIDVDSVRNKDDILRS